MAVGMLVCVSVDSPFHVEASWHFFELWDGDRRFKVASSSRKQPPASQLQPVLGNYKPTNATSRLQQKAHDLEQLQAKNFDIAR